MTPRGGLQKPSSLAAQVGWILRNKLKSLLFLSIVRAALQIMRRSASLRNAFIPRLTLLRLAVWR